MPVAAAGLADVGAGDPHPLVARPARPASARSSSRLRVSSSARSRERQRGPRRPGRRARRGPAPARRGRATRGSPRRRATPVSISTRREGLGDERARARARGGRSGGAARRGPGARRRRRRSAVGAVSVEQIRHRPDRECRSPRRPGADHVRLRTGCRRLDRRAAIQSASSTAIWGTPLTWTAAIAIRRGLRLDAAARRPVAPNSRPSGPRSSAITSVPCAQLAGLARQRLARRGVADAEPPSSLLGVEGAQRDPGLDDRDRQRVVGQAAALEGAVVEALEGELLDRGAGAVGVEADLAEEDPVGPGDRPFAHVDRVARRRSGRRGRAGGGAPARGCGPDGRRPRPRRSRGRGTRRRRAARPSPARAPAPSRHRGRRPAISRLRRARSRAAARSTRASSCGGA